MESGRLNGKTAIVTGGARGIGFGIASRYADEGARVVIADVLEEEGRKAAMDIGPTAEFYQINLRDRGQTIRHGGLCSMNHTGILIYW